MIICSIPAWLKRSVFRLLNFSALAANYFAVYIMADDRVLCDPCLTVGVLEKVFTLYFAATSRDLQPLLNVFGAETWKTAPKALM